MLTLITCPTCHHKFSVPEGSMGQRRTCPNCESIFVAGKSVAESNGRINGQSRRGLLERAAAAGEPAAASVSSAPPLDKTMLAEVDAPIRYNCPRCKKPLESPVGEAGTKKPCPSCGGRLQVPAAPPRPALDPSLNKTLLAEGIGAAPPPSIPAPALLPTSAAASAEPLAKPETGLNRRQRILIGSLAAAGVLVAVLYFVGQHNSTLEQERWLQAQKQELDKLKAEIDQKTSLMQQQQQLEAQQRRQWDELVAKQEARQRQLDREREQQRVFNDKREAAEAQALLERKQRELDEERKRAADQQAKSERDMKDRLDDLKRQVDNANNRSTTVITQPPPPYYPWNYYNRYWGW